MRQKSLIPIFVSLATILERSFVTGIANKPPTEQESSTSSPTSEISGKSFNYYFDFESAVISGLTPDWSPNRNNTPSDSILQSSPGCPEPYHGTPWVFYGNPPKCYLSGYSFACPKNMILLPQESSFYGYCDCNCTGYSFASNTRTSLRYCFGHTSEGKNRILAYYKDLGTCQPIFEQGDCPEGEWFIFGDNPLLGPFCEKRRCPIAALNKDGNDTLSFYDYRKKSCHKLGEPCQSPYSFWSGRTQYHLSGQDWNPVCQLPPPAPQSAPFFASTFGCASGEKYSNILKMCIPKPRANSGEVG